MTYSHVALLRGVNNVGKASRVSMADLRMVFGSLGFSDVRTLLNSGNVVFSVHGNRRRGLLARIETALAASLGFNSSVIVLSADELAALVHDNPLTRVASDPSRLLFVVPTAASDLERVTALLERRWAPEVLAVGPRCAYLWCANGVGQSSLWPAVDRALGRLGTARNMGTMTKLLALVEAPPS